MAKINIELIGEANRKTVNRLYSNLISAGSLLLLQRTDDKDKKQQLLIETGCIECLEVHEEVSAFVQKCKHILHVLKAYACFRYVEWSLLITVISDDETIHPSACLSSDTIHFLSELNADVGFLYYTIGEY